MPKNWLFVAGTLWPILTKAAASRRILTYSDAAPIIGTNPLSMRYALGPIQDYCLETRRPPLTSIMVNKATRKPGGGFFAWDVDDLESGQRQTFEFAWDSVSNPFANLAPDDTIDSLANRLIERPQEAAEVYRLVPDRGVGQLVFRAALLKAYDYQCAICGTTFTEMLEAAHIVPWSRAPRHLRVSVQNGVLLCANHHRLFDTGKVLINKDSTVFSSDPREEDGFYTDSDKSIVTAFHGAKMRLPENRRLQPSGELLGARYRATTEKNPSESD